MNDSNNTQYALHADPGKPLRDAQAEIDNLKHRIENMKTMHKRDVDSLNHQIDEMITERNVYRSLVLKVMKIKDD